MIPLEPDRTEIPGWQDGRLYVQPLNQLTQVTDWNNRSTNYSYDSRGELTAVARPNNVNSAYSYKRRRQLTQIQHASGTEALAPISIPMMPPGTAPKRSETTQGGGEPGRPSRYRWQVRTENR